VSQYDEEQLEPTTEDSVEADEATEPSVDPT
jgi:hypothetical protein